VEWSYPAAAGILQWPLRYRLRWSIEGLDEIPERGGLILASNHISYLDPLVLGYVARQRNRRVRFLAKAELFAKPVLGYLLRNARQIPVQRRTSHAADALVGGLDALAHGECVAVFPEGTISPDLNPMPGHTGTARLAALAGVPVVPVGLWGSHRMATKGRDPSWRIAPAQSVVIGAPLGVDPDEDVHEATDRVMGAICEAVRAARSRYPDPAGPTDWWYRAPEAAVLRSCQETS
jgi:1-acyl-sn-glycerol-3-phosphate acyltransferase